MPRWVVDLHFTGVRELKLHEFDALSAADSCTTHSCTGDLYTRTTVAAPDLGAAAEQAAAPLRAALNGVGISPDLVSATVATPAGAERAITHPKPRAMVNAAEAARIAGVSRARVATLLAPYPALGRDRTAPDPVAHTGAGTLLWNRGAIVRWRDLRDTTNDPWKNRRPQQPHGAAE